MSDLHRALGFVAIVVALVTTLTAALVSARPAAVGRADARILLDRIILVELGVVALAIFVGLPLALGGAGPADPLHYLYAVAALLTLPIGRALGRTGRVAGQIGGRRPGAAIGLAGFVLVGVLVRLFMTGK